MSSNATLAPKSHYIYGIDIVRFAAALSVATFHLTRRVPGFSTYMPFGWVGVQIFFVISGIVIANSAQHRCPSSFALSRFYRLYPTAWCTGLISIPLVFFSLPIVYQHFGLDCSRSFPAMLSSIALIGRVFVTSSYWTLQIEIAFYLLLLLLIGLHRINKLESLAVLLVLWSLIYKTILLVANHFPALHLKFFSDGADDFYYGYGMGQMLLLRYGQYFAVGILIWLAKFQKINWLGGLALVIALSSAMDEIHSRAYDIASDIAAKSGTGAITVSSMTLFACTTFFMGLALIMLSVTYCEKFPKNSHLRKFIRMAGLITYPYYLLHESVGGFMLFHLTRYRLSFPLALLVSLVTVGVIAYVVAFFCEPLLTNKIKQLAAYAKT